MKTTGSGEKPTKSVKRPLPPPPGPFELLLEALKKNSVQYLVIGGQAVIAYGAGQFTRDGDLWVRPTAGNVSLLRRALEELNAERRFLPPLELIFLKKGHGVHFRFRHEGKDFCVDILGKPPRVSTFSSAWKDAVWIKWRGIDVPLLDIPRLIATKKTDREKDYLVIKTLAELVYDESLRDHKLRLRSRGWLVRESRTPDHLQEIARNWSGGVGVLLRSGRLAAERAAHGASRELIEDALRLEQAELMKQNREYWKPILAELRQLSRVHRPARKNTGPIHIRPR